MARKIAASKSKKQLINRGKCLANPSQKTQVLNRKGEKRIEREKETGKEDTKKKPKRTLTYVKRCLTSLTMK